MSFRLKIATRSTIIITLFIAVCGFLQSCEEKNSTSAEAKKQQNAPEDTIKQPEPVAAPSEKIPRETLWKASYQASLDRGVKWILDNQHKDGSWGHFLPERPGDIYYGGVNSLKAFGTASSALCCMALLMQPPSETIDTSLKKGYQYLVSAPENRRINGDTFYNVWTHCYMIQALTRGLGDERLKEMCTEIKKRTEMEIEGLFRLQSPNGGFGYYDFNQNTYHPSGYHATSFVTATALVAMHEARSAGFDIPDNRVNLALKYLLSQRYPNGSYSYSTGLQRYPQLSVNHIRGSLGRSQACNNGLIAWGRISEKDIVKGFNDFIEQHGFLEIGRCRQYPHEAWYAIAPYYYYYGHYYASRNLAELPEDCRTAFAEKLADLIILTQFDDGSFWDYPLFGYTKAYGTGFGVLIMSNCRKHLE
ncbi:MAG: hypothetical protein ABIH42_07165 [Planctomycetota bacterium]